MVTLQVVLLRHHFELHVLLTCSAVQVGQRVLHARVHLLRTQLGVVILV